MYALRKDRNNKLYFINLVKANDKQIASLKHDNNVLFVDEKQLPSITDSNREIPVVYYMLDNNGDIIIDWERTNQKWVESKKQQLSSLIELYYPAIDRENDLAKKLYYEVYLKGLYPSLNIEALIMKLVLKYFEESKQNGYYEDVKSFLIRNVSFKEEDYYAYINLLVIGIKIYWVRLCENILSESLKQLKEPVYPDFPF